MIIVSSNAALSDNPADNKQYAANTSVGKGDAISNGYTVYNGTGNSITVSNLTANTKYYFTVIEYNGTGSTLSYATSVAYIATTTTLADTDGDGVADIYDAYPNDPNKAFNNYFPASGFSTLMYEDQWPSKGDYDFNDIVVDYRYNIVTNAANNVVEANYSFLPRAAGCIYKNSFAFQLDGVTADKISSVTGTKSAWTQVNPNGTEAGQTNNNANILVTDNFFNLFAGRSGNDMVNTVPSIAKLNADTVSVSVKFIVNGVAATGGTVSFTNFGSNVFNPYIIVSQTRGHEIHLADRIPSSKMDMTLFGTADDKSNPSQGTYYRTANNLPWALNIVSSVPYPTETTDITTAYLNLIKWAVSGGSLNTDWYLALSGYRDNTKIYNK